MKTPLSRSRRLGAPIETVPCRRDPEAVIARPEATAEGLARDIDDMRAGPREAEYYER